MTSPAYLAAIQAAAGEVASPPETPVRDWPVLEPGGLYGPAGEAAEAVAEFTEADPVGIYASLLAMLGNALGRGPHVVVDGARHYPNLFTLLVGSTSRGRKGTAEAQALALMSRAAPEWRERCPKSGLSTGEGLIHHVRDPLEVEEIGADGIPRRVTKDAGEAEKRLLVRAPEFASVLRVARREASTLSAVLREAWDTGDLSTLTKHSPTRATGAHVSLLGQITPDELRKELTSTDVANGLANRFLLIGVRRRRPLPLGLPVPDQLGEELAAPLRRAIAYGSDLRELPVSSEARGLYSDLYDELTEDRPGLLGALLARGSAHVMRLAALFAALDTGTTPALREVQAVHLGAANALWRYAVDSAVFVFGDALGDPLQERLLEALRDAGADGLTRTQLHGSAGNHASGQALGQALTALVGAGRIERTRRATGGRPVEEFRLLGSSFAPQGGNGNGSEGKEKSEESVFPTLPTSQGAKKEVRSNSEPPEAGAA